MGAFVEVVELRYADPNNLPENAQVINSLPHAVAAKHRFDLLRELASLEGEHSHEAWKALGERFDSHEDFKTWQKRMRKHFRSIDSTPERTLLVRVKTRIWVPTRQAITDEDRAEDLRRGRHS